MAVLLEFVRRTCNAGATFGGILILAAAAIVTTDVAIRWFFGMSIGGADELTGFALGIGSALAFGYALVERAHIRIDTVSALIPKRARAVLDVLALGAFTSFMALVAWYAYGVLDQTIESGSRSMSELRVPLVIPQLAWVAGYCLFVLTALALLAVSVVRLARRQEDEVKKLIGSITVEEEVDREIGAAPPARSVDD